MIVLPAETGSSATPTGRQSAWVMIRAHAGTSGHAGEEIRICLLVGISAFSHFRDPSSILVNQEPG